MTFNSQDRNTALTVAIVLVVCTVTLVAIMSSLLQLLEPVFSGAGRVLSSVAVQAVPVDYDFSPTLPATNIANAVTVVQSATSTSAAPQPTANYNFRPSGAALTSTQRSWIGREANLWQNVPLQQAETAVTANLTIAKIGLNAPVFTGMSGRSLLKQGMWNITPTANLLTEEAILLCQRTYLAPDDSRSCWYLDAVRAGNEIVIQQDNVEYVYTVDGVNTFQGSFIYQPSGVAKLKLVSNDPKGENKSRLVILASLQTVRYAEPH